MALFAQGIITGTIIGTVQDCSGAVIIDAKVTATSSVTNITTTVVTGSAGDYSFNNLPIGVYSLVISSPGFSDLQLGNVSVETGTYNNLDASIYKNNKITACLNMQLQATFFDALNCGYYGIPDVSLESSTFLLSRQTLGQSVMCNSAPNSCSNRKLRKG